MKLASFFLLAVALPLTLAAGSARADDNPCGKFDFSSGLDCRIEVEGGCTAQCTPLNFEAGCTGQCVETPAPPCVDSCGEQCITECNPALLDCFKGCHEECDEPTNQRCIADHPSDDCVNLAKAQCDIHCQDSCKVPPSSCKEHCESCCTGSCSSQINFSCNYDCFIDLSGGCNVQCQDPSGAIFCNGQYVHASDITACISYLAAKGIKVDVSAQGKVTCGLSGCTGTGDIAAGACAAAPIGAAGGVGSAFGALAIFGLGLGIASERRRQRK